MPINIAQFERTLSLQNSLRDANVSEAATEKVLEDEKRRIMVSGYVKQVYTRLNITTVTIFGDPPVSMFAFPPNPPQFLAELIRAHNNTQMRVIIYAKESFPLAPQTANGLIDAVVVDAPDPPAAALVAEAVKGAQQALAHSF